MAALPIPAIKAIAEVTEVLSKVPKEHRGLSLERTLESSAPNDVSRRFERALATEWARLNDSSRGKEMLVSILCRSSGSLKYPNGFRRVKQRDQLVAASVIQWLGTRMVNVFSEMPFKKLGEHVSSRILQTNDSPMTRTCHWHFF